MLISKLVTVQFHKLLHFPNHHKHLFPWKILPTVLLHLMVLIWAKCFISLNLPFTMLVHVMVQKIHYFTRTIPILFFHLLLGGSAPTMLHVWHLAIIDELHQSHSSIHDHGITSSAGVSAPHVHVPVSHAPVSDAPSPFASAHCALALYVPVQCAASPSHWNVCNLLFTRPNTQQHFKQMAPDTSAHISQH